MNTCNKFRNNAPSPRRARGGASFLTFLLFFLLAFAGGALQEAHATLSGEGTADKPYLIQSNDDWDYLVANYTRVGDTKDKYFKITKSLEGLESFITMFEGYLDGCGNTLTFNENSQCFIRTASSCTIENLVVEGVIKSRYVFNNAYSGLMNNCIINLTTVSQDTPKLYGNTGNLYLANSIVMFQGIVKYSFDSDGYVGTDAYRLNLDEGVKPSRSGGKKICGGRGFVYEDGFEMDGYHGYCQNATVTVSVPGVVIEEYTLGNLNSIRPDESSVSFSMPKRDVTMAITKKSVRYLNSQGGTVTASEFTLLTDGRTITKQGGVYVASGDVSIEDGLVFSDNATLILADGSSLTINKDCTNTSDAALKVSGNLTITGQEGGTGTLTINAEGNEPAVETYVWYHSGIYAKDKFNVNGANVKVNMTRPDYLTYGGTLNLRGIYSGGEMNLRRGSVDCYNDIGNEKANTISTAIYSDGNINISGGQVKADGEFSEGISIKDNDKYIILDWSNETDEYNAKKYNGTVKVKDYKYIYNGANSVSGTITDFNNINARFLTPCLDLWNDGNNTDKLTKYDGWNIAIIIIDRTFYKDGSWNTLCLPITMHPIGFNNFIGSYGTLMELDTEGIYDGHRTGIEGDILYLYFTQATTITAGKPYIIKWDRGNNLSNPDFHSSLLSKAAPQPVTFNGGKFVGTYDEIKGADNDGQTYITLGANNTLGYMKAGKSLHTFRAHFEIDKGIQVKGYQLSFGDGETTGIVPINAEHETDGIYTLDGLRLDAMPTRKGIYIKDGKKVVVND